MNRNKIVVIDTETTGLDPKRDYIVEIAAVILDCNTLQYKILFDRVCNPGLSKNTLENTWICNNGYFSPEEILNSPIDSVVAEKLRIVLGNYPWTTFNLDFDSGFLWRKPWNLTKNTLHCIMKAAKPVCAIPHPYYAMKFPKLEEAYQMFFHSLPTNSHRALADAIIAVEVLIYLKKNKHY